MKFFTTPAIVGTLGWAMLVATGSLHAQNVAPPRADSDLPAGDGVFESVPTAEGVWSLAASEDGKYLAAAETHTDHVVVWNIPTGKLTARIDFPNPRAILWRGDRLFVGGGSPELMAFNSSKQWKEDGRFKIWPGGVETLTAPRGKYFDGKIIGVAYSKSFVLDTVSSQFTERTFESDRDSAANASYDGRIVIEQGNLDGTPPGNPDTWDYQDYISNKPRKQRDRRAMTVGILRQNRPGAIWYSPSGLWAGNPISPIVGGPPSRNIFVQDSLADVFYKIGDDAVEWFKLDASMARLGSRSFKFAGAYRLPFRPEGGLHGHFPVAVTIDGRLHLFVFVGGQPQSLHRFSTSVAEPLAVAEPPHTGIPAKVFEGKPVSCRLFDEKVDGVFTVLKGPPEISVSAAGVVSWTPQHNDVGVLEIKIRVERGKNETSFLRYSVEVVSADAAAHAEHDVGKAHELGRHFLLSQQFFAVPGFANKSILLLDGQTLRILDADGQAVISEFRLPDTYLRIAERKDRFVAQSAHAVDILDHQTLAVVRHVPITADEIVDMTCDPVRPATYLCCKIANKQFMPMRRMFAVDEDTGQVDSDTGIRATRLAIEPSGQRAFVALDNMIDRVWYPRNTKWIFPQSVLEKPERGLPISQALIWYDISAKPWKFVGANLAPAELTHNAEGDFYLGLALSPDAAQIAYLSTYGYDEHQIPAFSTGAVKKAVVAFEFSRPVSCSYHPVLDLVALTGGGQIKLFSSTTGKESERRLDLDDAIKTASRLLFTPGGRHLMIAYVGKEERLLLRAVPLRLDPEESRLVLTGSHPPVRHDFPAADSVLTIPAGELDALQRSPGPEKSAREIAKQFSPAVVVVESRDGFGTGFFVGRNGYVLTCAHVLPKVGDPFVRLKSDGNAGADDKKLPATIVQKDEDLDLALLKVQTSKPVTFVRIAVGDAEAGEPVTVIGNPGLGHEVLDFTVTTGIVSNASRKLMQKTYIQTNAAVNPGNSGGPVFNGHGEVIGVAVLKANIENTAFAIPSQSIRNFLGALQESQPK